MAGWLFISSKMLEAATVALAFGAYAALYLSFDFRIFAVIAVIAITALNIVGIRASTDASKVMTVIKVGALSVFALVGVASIRPANYQPFAPTGITGVLTAAALVFFAYTGFARIATLGEEIKNPEKTIPKAIIVALSITAVVYIAATTVGIGLIGPEAFGNSNSPIAAAASALGSPALVALIIIGAGVATISVLLSDLLSSSRTVFAMSRNGDFPEILSKLRNVNPVNSIIATSAIVLILVLVGSLVQIAALTSLTILIYYTITNLSSLRLKKEKRRFPKIIPIAGLISCLSLTVFLPLQQWIWTIILIALGIIFIIGWKKCSKKAVFPLGYR